MTPVQIAAEISRIEALAAAKGYYDPTMTVRMNWIGYELSSEVTLRTSAYSSENSKYIHVSYEDGFSALFSQMEHHISTVPSIEDAKRDAFIAAVGRLIDQGKEIGIQVDFLNPLTEMMTKLSSNIITKV
jgi:hypothetical protein